jgi:hypothetical protein
LREIHQAVESLYVNGRPLHHLPSARSVVYNPDDRNQSSIFVVEYADFCKMAAVVIQDIFSKRHILVIGCPLPPEDFNCETLSHFGNLDSMRDIQGK